MLQAASLYQAAALSLIDKPFLSTSPVRPTMEWAQAIPRRGDLESADWRTNIDGFLQMNGIIMLIDAMAMLPASGAQSQRFDKWLRRAPYAWCPLQRLYFPVIRHCIVTCTKNECKGIASASHTQRMCGPCLAHMSDQTLTPCRQYGAWLAEWRERNEKRFNVRASVWSRAQSAAIARHAAQRTQYETLCVEGRTLDDAPL